MRHGERDVVGVDSRYGVGRAEKVVAAQELARKESRRSSTKAPPSGFAPAVDLRRQLRRTAVRALEGFFSGFFRSAPRISPPAMGDENRLSQ
jgi:hypothetical protein